ncbi:unnamed protein product [Brassica napus]|uniref:(rape) hypothetical protein n=1 Tax=Brassica napus TaxID=3708 RepID=A0A816P0U6_BRANA|nr:unnamed protein product [Brassica napus]
MSAYYVVWVTAMSIKEIDDDDEKKYIVKACDYPWNLKDIKARPNKTLDLPPFYAEEHLLVGCVEAFHRTHRHQGRVTGMMSEKWIYGKWCKVFLEATNQELCFKLSDIRPSKVWKDCVWKREHNLNSVEIVEENVAMDFPFEKKEDCREMSAVGLMLTFSHLGRVLP